VSLDDAPRLYPLFLKLTGREVLVVGAGAVAERKIAALLEAEARVGVVAPEATPGIAALAGEGKIAWERRGFVRADVDAARLVIAATSDAQVQKEVTEACEARGVFVVAVDDPPNATAYAGAVVRRPPFLIAISSSGVAPALTRLVKEVVEAMLPGDDVVEAATRLREKWKKEGTPMAERFGELVKEIRK
jgi:uroporphyrin-III C-methyltransferase/precorrin-2 dehydrogenase/sirohydrochlorin ferrochelatase